MRLFELSQRRTKQIDINNIDLSKVQIAIEQFKKGVVLGRTFPSTSPIMYGDSSQIERKSRNTSNEYTLLLQRFPEWKKYPPRNRSFICSLYQGIPEHHYKTIVLPFDDPMVGLCSDEDFWGSFNIGNNIDDYVDLPHEINEILQNTANIFSEPLNNDNPDILIQQLRDLHKLVKSQPERYLKYKEQHSSVMHIDTYKMIMSELFEGDDIIAALQDIYNPTKNGFRVERLSTIYDYKDDIEAWFSGPAYFIEQRYITMVIK